MGRAVYRSDTELVRDLRKSAIHLANGDEIGLDLRKRVMARAMATLCTERQRRALYLYYGRWLTLEEISRLLGVDPSSVSRRIQKGIDHVKQAMKLVEGEV